MRACRSDRPSASVQCSSSSRSMNRYIRLSVSGFAILSSTTLIILRNSSVLFMVMAPFHDYSALALILYAIIAMILQPAY